MISAVCACVTEVLYPAGYFTSNRPITWLGKPRSGLPSPRFRGLQHPSAQPLGDTIGLIDDADGLTDDDALLSYGACSECCLPRIWGCRHAD
jgi:hypothetical protein